MSQEKPEKKEDEQPSFKIRYFYFHGRGACLRAAATFGGVSYEDELVSFEEFGKQRSDGKLRWYGVPELVVYDKEGKTVGTIGQSNACLRYIGRLTGLYPENFVQRALVDEVLDSVEDVSALALPSVKEKDADKKKAMREELIKPDKLPYWLGKFNSRFEENEKRGNKNGFVVGDSMTIADLKLYFSINNYYSGGMDYIDGEKLFAEYPKLKAFVVMMTELDGMKKFQEDFKQEQADFKEKKASNFKKAGKGAYGAL